MKAIGLYENLPIEDEKSLIDVIINKPCAEGKDLLVKVKAIAVNPVDYKIRKKDLLIMDHRFLAGMLQELLKR